MMKLTRFAERFSKKTGIGELMDDRSDMRMLGGGNPAHIPEVNEIWRRRSAEILANYDTPQEKYAFLDSLAGLLNREFGWNLSAKNIAVTNGSQGKVLVRPLIDSGDILRLSGKVIRPFYERRSKSASPPCRNHSATRFAG